MQFAGRIRSSTRSTAEAAALSLSEQYAAMPAGPERRAFFKKHKAVLFAAK